MTEANNALSTKDYWDASLGGVRLPRLHDTSRHNTKAIIDFLDSVLKDAGAKTLMEIGCAASGWLPYFRKRYGYRVSGLDYSETGCAMARENMRLLGLEYEEIICADMFAWEPGKKYDIILSFGVIEHFNSQDELIKTMVAHLNEGGILITVVPNLRGMMGFISRTLFPEVHKIHKVLSREDLIGLNAGAGLREIRTDYAGVFSLAVLPWAKSGLFFLSGNTFCGRFSLRVLNQLDRLLSWLLKGLDRPVSSLLSPYVIPAAGR